MKAFKIPMHRLSLKISKLSDPQKFFPKRCWNLGCCFRKLPNLNSNYKSDNIYYSFFKDFI